MLLLKNESREELKKGIDKLADAVRVTLGPKGRNAVINSKRGPFITKDGVTVAQSVKLSGVEQMGAALIREASMRTNEAVGDGTTTATILAHAIVHYGMTELKKRNALDVKEEIDTRTREIVRDLKKLSKKITKDQVAQVAAISANSKEIGDIIADVFKTVGMDGVVTVERGNKIGIFTEKVNGLQFQRGTISPYLASSLTEPAVLISSAKITSASELIPIMSKLANSGKKELFIIAEDITDEALALIVTNKIKGNLDILAIKAPGFGEVGKEYLHDIAALLEGTVIDGKVRKFEDIELAELGRCGSVKIKGQVTTIVGGSGDISGRIKEIKEAIEDAAPYDRNILKTRLAGLANGVAVIRVGSASETESGEVKDRIEDAVNATKHALTDGILPGGGMALKRLSKGNSIVDRAIREPHKQILKNAGIKSMKIGEEVIDATKVVITALENASSVASMILTTDVVINNED